MNRNPLLYCVIAICAVFAFTQIVDAIVEVKTTPSLTACQTEDSVPNEGSCIWNGGNNGKGNVVINHSDGTYTVIPQNQ